MLGNRRTRILALLGVASIATACEDSPTESGGPRPTITLQQTEAVVIPGDAIGPTYRIWLSIPYTVEHNGVSGSLTVTTAGNALMTLGPLPVSDNPTATGFVYAQVDPSLGVGTHQVPIIVSNGTVSDTALFTLRVPSFRMWLVARRVALSQGATQRISVGIKSADSEAKTVTVSGLPAGVTSTVTSLPPTVQLTAAPDAELGTFHITVQVASSTLAESRLFDLTVQPPQTTRPIAFRFCWSQTRPLNVQQGLIGPSTVYYANDGGGWTSVAPDADDVIRFNATEKVAMAWTSFAQHQYGPGPFLRVIHATATELEQMQCPRSSGTKSFRLKVENADQYSVGLGAFKARALTTPPLASTSSLGLGANGPLDLIVAGMRFFLPSNQRFIVVRRGVDLANLDTIRADLASSEAAAVDSATYTVSGAASAGPETRLHTLTTVGSLSGAVVSLFNYYFAVPASQLAPADVQSVIATSVSSQTTRGIVHYFRTASPLDVALGPAVGNPTVDSAAATITLAMQAEYPDVAGAGQRYVLDGRGIYADVEVWMTKGYATSPSSWTLAAPDCAGMTSCTPRVWFNGNASAAAASTNGASPAVFFGATPPAGTRVTWSVTNWGLMAAGLPFPLDR